MEAKVANDGIVLNNVQLAALEKAKNKREATGEIETMHPPGYLGVSAKIKGTRKLH